VKRYIIWTQAGYGNWQPAQFDSLAEAAQWIQSGQNYGSSFELTQHMPFTIAPAVVQHEEETLP
jgi:hypothetical protein